jgi:serine protease Do
MNIRWNLTQPTVLLGATLAMTVLIAPCTVAQTETIPNELAKSVTVRIVGVESAGSGVLVAHEGQTFTLVTTAHVFDSADVYTVIMPDGQSYPLSGIEKHPSRDLAIAQFTSASNYPTVQIGDASTITEGTPVYIAGYPAKTAAINESVFSFTKGAVIANATSGLKDGYGLIYNNTTLPGMSGGPILTANGALIGIHGRADAQEKYQDQQVNPTIYIKSGANLGIPINAMFELMPKDNVAFAPTTAPIAIPGAPSVDTALINDLRAQADFKLRRQDYAGAIALMDKAIQLDSQNPVLYEERGNLYLFNQDYLSALIDFKQVSQLDPTQGEAHYNQGIAYLRSGSPKESKASFERALELFRQQGKTEKAEAALQQLKGF